MTQSITFLLAISLIGMPIPQEYRGVVPLEWTRKHVEKLFTSLGSAVGKDEPATKDSYLRCPAPEVTNEQEGDVGFLKIDAYGNISTREESKRLDEFVTRLKTQPPIQAYIVAYGGRKSWPGEAKYRANCVKEYLVKKHKIAEHWVTTIDGGYQEQAIVELYISLTGASPITSPTLDRKDVQIIKNRGTSGQGKCRLTSRVPQRTLYNQERKKSH